MTESWMREHLVSNVSYNIVNILYDFLQGVTNNFRFARIVHNII